MFEYTYRERIRNWIRRYPLWYLGVLLANLFVLVILYPYGLFNEYILRRQANLSDWGFILSHFTEEMHRTQPLYKPQEYPNPTTTPSDFNNCDINSLYPSSISAVSFGIENKNETLNESNKGDKDGYI